jgi:putative restriction endonuclease
MRLSKRDLLAVFTRAVADAGWQLFQLPTPTTNPARFRIFRDAEAYTVRLYIWNLTHGGGQQRPVDEYRIQVTGVPQFTEEPGGSVLILGWWSQAEVFAGFDFERHRGALGLSPSMQIREACLRQAYTDGIATQLKENREIAVAFRPDLAVEYIRNLQPLHTIGRSPRDLEVFNEVVSKPEAVNDAVIAAASRQRRATISSVTRALRASSFKARVLTAYNHRCACCSLQLDVIDAAHIVPVAHEASTDETCNGLALCPLHHRALDRVLVSVDDQYRVITNTAEMHRLAEIGHDGGAADFVANLRPIINLPPAVNDRPRLQYLSLGRSLRGWPARLMA